MAFDMHCSEDRHQGCGIRRWRPEISASCGHLSSEKKKTLQNRNNKSSIFLMCDRFLWFVSLLFVYVCSSVPILLSFCLLVSLLYRWALFVVFWASTFLPPPRQFPQPNLSVYFLMSFGTVLVFVGKLLFCYALIDAYWSPALCGAFGPTIPGWRFKFWKPFPKSTWKRILTSFKC